MQDSGIPDPAEVPLPAETASETDERNSSSTSSTPNSTSTYAYSHEPYETYQHKVVALGHTLGDCEGVILQRRRGGSYNRVIIAELVRKNDRVRGIFRTPRFPEAGPRAANDETVEEGEKDDDVQDQAAVLHFLATKGVHAPKLLAFDTRAENPIRAPYVFQEFASGVVLESAYEFMSLPEKLSVVDALVDIMISAEQVKFPQSGTLVTSGRHSAPTSGSYLFDKQGPELAVRVQPFKAGSEDATSAFLPDLLASKIHAYLEEDLGCGVEDVVVTRMWRRPPEILAEMRTKGFFETADTPSMSTAHSVLYHWDLEPRNIILKRGEAEESRWEVDLVIDWDGVLTVPSVLVRKPPAWLWDFQDDEFGHASIGSDYDCDVDLLDLERYADDAGRLSEDDLQIKHYFEDRLVEALGQLHPGYSKERYWQEAYGTGRWIRRIARFALHGASDSRDFKRFEHFERQWLVFMKKEEGS